MKNFGRLKIFIISILAAAGLLIFYTYKNAPELTYTIVSSDTGEEHPMELSLAETGKAITFRVSFRDKPGAVSSAYLHKELKHNVFPPYLYFGEDLELRVKSSSVQEDSEPILYTIDGKVENLSNKSYRLRIIDANSNLIDEKLFELKLK